MASTIQQQLDHSGLFRKFPADAKQRLAKSARSRTLRDGDCVYRPGDKPTALHGVLAGGIKLTGEDPTGKYYLYGLIQPGWWFGEISALDGHPRAQSANAIGETEIIAIPRDRLLAELDAHPELYKHFVDILCNRLRLAGVVIEEVAFLSTPLRLARHLLRLHHSRQTFHVKQSQEEIASSLGVTRQSIYRVLKEWQQYQWINVNYGDIEILQADALRNFIEEQE